MLKTQSNFDNELAGLLVRQSEDPFDKIYRSEINQRAAEAKASGFYPYFNAIAEHKGGTVIVDGQEFILTGSNDYLGLTQDPRLVEAATQALNRFGTSCTGSRFLTGTLTIHEELEHELANFLGFESALVFSAGFLACAASVAALAGRHDIIYFDRENHASLYDGAKLSNATLRRYHHNDVRDLERLLEADSDKQGGRLIYADGVFSMTGHIVNLPEIVKVARRYGARVIVDEAHATGTLGSTGRGTGEHFGLQSEIDLVCGTFSKAFASVGGFVAGSHQVIEYIKHTARPFLFNASLPGASAAAALKALEIMKNESWHRQTLWQNVRFVRNGLLSLGFNLLGSQTQIIPVLIGEEELTRRFWHSLWEQGIFTTPALPPAVPEGMGLIRTSYNSAHSESHLIKVLEAFEKTGKKFGVI